MSGLSVSGLWHGVWSRWGQLIRCELVVTTESKGAVFLGDCEEAGGRWAALVPAGRKEQVGRCWHRGRGVGHLKAPLYSLNAGTFL